MQGILLIDKPSGWTSFDVVNYVRKIVAAGEGKKPKNCKVGHTGTLDPLATGLLILLIGKDYTRRAGELSKQDKTYHVTMKLGATTATGDAEAAEEPVSDIIPTAVQLTEAIQRFTGDIMQVPPAYSAMKINGQRAYKLARAGQQVVLQPRPATIYDSQLTNYTYPLVHFTCRVSSGTYIRSLVQDIGQQLHTGAYMAGLRRTSIADYQVADAQNLEKLDGSELEANLQTLAAVSA